jgi:branched-chain amino acid transport system permease protein
MEFLDAYLITILNGLARGVLLFALASGLSLVFGLMDLLNVAHGSVLVIGAYVALTLAPDGRGFWLAAAAAVVVGALFGLVLLVMVKPIQGHGHLDQVLVTLGLAFIVGDLSGRLWDRNIHSLQPPPPLGGSVAILGQPYPVYRLAVIAVGVVLAVGLYLLFERTMLGAVVRAAVADRDMVSALGIDVGRVFVGVVALATALAAFGGVIGGPILGVRPGLDFQVLILALIVVVIGGLGSLRGALVGSILIGLVQSLGPVLFPQFASFLLFGAMALVLMFRPAGLYGRTA